MIEKLVVSEEHHGTKRHELAVSKGEKVGLPQLAFAPLPKLGQVRMNLLLIFVPIAITLEFFAPELHFLVFLAPHLPSCLLPAGWAGRQNILRREWERELGGSLTRPLATQLNLSSLSPHCVLGFTTW